MNAVFGASIGRALIAAAAFMLLSAGAASAQQPQPQMCPQPYTQAISPQTGDVCTSTCAPGSFPVIENNAVACKPGYATGICPEGEEFMVMTPQGPICQKGYAPVPVANNTFGCNPGDLRIERPPYQLNGALTYETCSPEPKCPAGYIETVDPDNALGSTRVCMLPCQDFVMNQSMACSCGSGGRLGVSTPGAPVRQICQPSCPSGSRWVASSPLYAFKAEEGRCVPMQPGGRPVTLVDVQPSCPGAAYWNGQVCLPIGGSGGSDNGPILIVGGCPGGTHWNGSHCVPDLVPLPFCGPGTHWNGLFCVPNGPQPCPIFTKWDGQKCVPVVQQVCPPGQHWNGVQCVPNFIVCLPPKKLVNGQCVFVPQPPCFPPKIIINGQCVLPPQPCLPPKQWINGQCILVPPPQPCLPPKKWINGQCVFVPQPPQICVPPKKWINGQCVFLPQPPQPCLPPKKWINGQCVFLPQPPQPCVPPKKWINGQCVFLPQPPQPCFPPKKIINGQCV
jgi:hypothetical protein